MGILRALLGVGWFGPGARMSPCRTLQEKAFSALEEISPVRVGTSLKS